MDVDVLWFVICGFVDLWICGFVVCLLMASLWFAFIEYSQFFNHYDQNMKWKFGDLNWLIVFSFRHRRAHHHGQAVVTREHSMFAVKCGQVFCGWHSDRLSLPLWPDPPVLWSRGYGHRYLRRSPLQPVQPVQTSTETRWWHLIRWVWYQIFVDFAAYLIPCSFVKSLFRQFCFKKMMCVN